MIKVQEMMSEIDGYIDGLESRDQADLDDKDLQNIKDLKDYRKQFIKLNYALNEI